MTAAGSAPGFCAILLARYKSKGKGAHLLWWATGVHLGWNWALGYLTDLPVSGLELLDAPFYDGVPQGAAWVGGGAFGPEGSAVATVGLAAAAWVCWKTPWLRPGPHVAATEPIAALRFPATGTTA